MKCPEKRDETRESSQQDYSDLWGLENIMRRKYEEVHANEKAYPAHNMPNNIFSRQQCNSADSHISLH